MFFISASDVAAIVGKNPYKTAEEILQKITKSAPSPDEVAEAEIASQPEEIRNQIRDIIKESKETVTSSSDAQNLVQKGLDIPVESAAIKEFITRKVSTNHGINNESKTARAFSVVPDPKFYKTPLADNVMLCGRIDGRLKDSPDVIVEIKNRRNRLFGRVPEYEMVQVQVYMALTGAQQCRFIEQYNEATKTYLLDWDPDYYDYQILEPLKKFASLIVKDA